MTKTSTSMDDYVERIEQDGLRLRAMMLQHVKRDTPVLIQGDNLAIEESVWREVLTCFGDSGELIGERITTSLPWRDAGRIPPARHL
jgi:hypothetical protein